MNAILFYVFSGLAIVSALGVVFLSRPTRALLSLIVTMFSLAILFIFLGAYFVAMIHMIVYAGAVLVLFLFVIMFQGIGAKELPLKERFGLGSLILLGLAGISFLSALLFILTRYQTPPPAGISGSVELVGKTLFQNYLLPFELTSIILLLGVFAAVALAKKDAT